MRCLPFINTGKNLIEYTAYFLGSVWWRVGVSPQARKSMFSLRKCVYDHTACENQHSDRKSAIHSSYIKFKKQKRKLMAYLTAVGSSLARVTCETSQALLANDQPFSPHITIDSAQNE